MVGGKPVVKEVQTHIDSKMEQMIIEDAQLQPQQVTIIHEDKKDKQEQNAKQKIVIGRTLFMGTKQKKITLT